MPRASSECSSGQNGRPDGIKIPYGRDPTGRVLHISEVDSGVVSGCSCPACGGPLVAYKGRQKQHHFGHLGNRTCSGAAETALHEFAKQVLRDNVGLWLPALIARHGNLERPVAPSRHFAYDTVEVEKPMPGMRPDIIVRRGDAELLVEIAVHHPCEPEKLALIRERRLPAIEIDLSHVRHDASPREHADAVLVTAARKWLFNRHIEAAESELRLQAEERARVKRERDEGRWGRLATDIRAAYASIQSEGDRSWLEAVEDAGLEELVGIPVQGDGCFAVAASVWQSAIVHQCLSNRWQYREFWVFEVADWCAEKGFLKAPFKAVPSQAASDMKAYLAQAVPGFRPPTQVIEDYMTGLARQGFLLKLRASWLAQTPVVDQARRQRDSVAAARARWTELEAELETIKTIAARGSEIDVEAWATQRRDELDGSPEDIVVAGGSAFTNLKYHLQSLAASLKPGAYPSSRSLLGLPLEADLEARRREYEEARRVDRERQEHAAALKRKQDTRIFLWELRSQATEAWGADPADEWLAQHIPADAVADSEPELPTDQITEVRSAFRRELRRREEEARAAAEVLRYKHELRGLAERDPELVASGRVEQWLRSSRPGLQGGRPIEYCVDRFTLAECEAQLPSRSGKKRR